MKMKQALAICLLSSTAWSVTTPALAQSDSSAAAPAPNESEIGDIIVTAQRRAERAQSTPLAITAVGGKELQSAAIKDIAGLSKSIPNVEFGGNGGDAKVFIRGVGYDSISPGGETRVAIYSNNVYQSRSQSAFTTLYDIDRIEVLRGPQGTLYGRNAVAGAMNIITADPGDHLNGYVTGQVGNYSLIQAEAAIGGPINDWLGVRIAGQTVDRGGYGHNIGSGEPVDDAHSRSVRGTLVAQFADNVKDRLVVDYYNARDHNYGYHILGGSFTAAEVSDPRLNAADYIPFAQKIGDRIPTNPQDYAGQNPQNHLLSYGLSNELSVDVSDLLTVTSVTGYRHVTATLLDNTYGGQKDLQPQSLYENSDSVTQELRLSGEKGILKYVIGGYYFNEDHVTDNRVPSSLVFFGGPENQWIQFYNAGGFETTNAYAAFGQVDMKILPKLTLSAGLRYSYEKKNIKEFQIIDFANAFDKNVTPLGPVIPTSGLAPQNHSWTSTDPRFTISYAFDPRVLAYATYSRGFKSGGFNLGGLQAPFNPERITDYEVGLKGDFLDGRLRANMSAFYYDYSNLQVNVVNQLVLQTLNAANAKIKGVEAEFTALPTPNLRLTLNGAWLDAYYTKFTTADPARAALGPLNLAGNRLNYAPKYKLAGSVAYTIHSPYGDFTPTADITWTDRLYFSPFNTSRISQPQHTNVDMSIRWVGKDPQWTGSIFVKNLTDKIYIIGAAIANPFVGSFRGAQVSAPRTFGAQLTRHF